MRKTEFFITSILFVLFVFFIFPGDQAPPGYFYYVITILAGMGGLFCYSRFYLFPQLEIKNIIFPLSILILSLLVSYCIPAYLLITLDYENKHPLYEPFILKEALSYLLLSIAGGGIYHLLKRPKLVKKILVFTGIFLLLGGTVFFTKYLIDIGYEGNESIRFLESDFKNIQEVINNEELKGKALFVEKHFL